MKWLVVVDVEPETTPGTNGCQMFVFNDFETQKEAEDCVEKLNELNERGRAFVVRN